MGAMLPNTPQSTLRREYLWKYVRVSVMCDTDPLDGCWARAHPWCPLSTVQHQNHNKSGLMFSSPDSEIFGQSSEILSLAHICNIRNHFPKFTMQIFTNEIGGPK